MNKTSFSEVAPMATRTHTASAAAEGYQYRSVVGATLLAGHAGQTAATMFSFSYLQETVDPAIRPVLFIFNGGPGASSLYCHLGGLGPHRAELAPPPVGYQHCGGVVANHESLLRVADLVFIDPPGTGFARVEAGKEGDFFGVDADAKAFCYFIKKWLSDHNRWLSPKFILGESYGTVRAAVISQELAGSVADGQLNGIALNGVIMLGQGLNMGPANAAGTDLPFIFALPSQIALAWHHGRSTLAAASFDEVIRQAREFVTAEYAPALFRGTALDEAESQRLSVRLASLTGIDAGIWQGGGLRLSAPAFAATLLAHEKKWISLYDGRYTFAAPRHAFDPVGDDPALTSMAVSSQMALRSHLTDTLGYTADDAYQVINFNVNGAWDFTTCHSTPFSFDVSQLMARSLHRNPAMRLFVGTGAYDLTTPLGSADFMLSRGNFPLERVTHAVYASGHSPFSTDAARRQISAELSHFITIASTRPT